MRYNLLTVCLLVVAQALICNYLHVSLYLTLSILPAIIICLPTRHSTMKALFIAFAMGFAVDFMSEGLLGLNIMALLPVALTRRTICDAIFGDELMNRGEDFSIRKYGPAKVGMAIAAGQIIFLLVYILADGGSARPLGDNIIRGIVSLTAGIMAGIPVADMLTKEDRR